MKKPRGLSPEQVQRVEQYLFARRQLRPATKTEIAGTLGIRKRDVEIAVQTLRARLVPIVSAGCGYWWEDSLSIIRRCRERLEGRISTQADTVRCLKMIEEKKAREMAVEPNGQARLFAGARP